ncbi:BQ5605_C004g02741 [Microbotryum silenes-dioicae]|uniref:BQ5605_C004g02741 protein n=1 Tax=Microbotryum silenes-dioicae TaxID=796604 RepID=A0A2X0P479_9BASI|nr:BQ5605_C004g02741 [Microbotryum silenes-dioicae]
MDGNTWGTKAVRLDTDEDDMIGGSATKRVCLCSVVGRLERARSRQGKAGVGWTRPDVPH